LPAQLERSACCQSPGRVGRGAEPGLDLQFSHAPSRALLSVKRSYCRAGLRLCNCHPINTRILLFCQPWFVKGPLRPDPRENPSKAPLSIDLQEPADPARIPTLTGSARRSTGKRTHPD
jgi:hypothetical protein